MSYLRSTIDIQHQWLIVRDDKPGLLPPTSTSFHHMMKETTQHAVLRCHWGLFLQEKEENKIQTTLWITRCHEFKSAIKPLEWSGVSVCCCSDWPERAALPLAWCSSLYTRGWLGCYHTTDGHGTPNTSHTPPEIKKTHVSSLRRRACQITQVM